MWSVNTCPKPGDLSRLTRTSSGTRRSDGASPRGSAGSLLAWAFIADPPLRGPSPVARPQRLVPADEPLLPSWALIGTADHPAGRSNKSASARRRRAVRPRDDLACHSLGDIVAN